MTAPTLPDDVREKVRAELRFAFQRNFSGFTLSDERCDNCIDAILLALFEAGYVVVPREPSEAMVSDGHAAAGVWRASDDACWLSAEDAAAVYSAMIAASEKP